MPLCMRGWRSSGCRWIGRLPALLWAWAAVLLMAWAWAWTAAEAAEEPVLYIDPGMHTLPIIQLAVDGSGQYVLTAGGEGSLRLWSVKDQQLVQTLRLPAAFDGPLAQVALSADASRIFLRMASGFPSAFELDRASGRLTALAADSVVMSKYPQHTASFRWIAGGGGWASYLPRVTVSTASGAPRLVPLSEQPFGNHFPSVPWSAVDRERGGRLVAADATRLCIYDPALKHLAEVALEPGAQVAQVRFSPDGSLVAVSYSSSSSSSILGRIEVRAGTDLHLLHAPALSGVNGALEQLAFSADGSLLFAGGTGSTAKGHTIRRWEQAGRGAYMDLAAGKGRVTALQALPQGGVVFATDEPEWGAISGQGALALRGRQTASLREAALLLDQRGERVGLGRGKDVTMFSLQPRPHLEVGAGDPSLRGPRLLHASARVTDWREQSRVQLNEERFELGSPAHAMAIAPNGRHVLFGLDGELWTYWRQQQQSGPPGSGDYWQPEHVRTSMRLWTPNPAWGVNVSGDGRWIAASLGDGTVRFYPNDIAQIEGGDPQEALTLYLHGDGRWVLYTPSGYYDAAPGAESLMRWQLERSATQLPELQTSEQQRARFYRPDIVRQVLALGSEAKARFAASTASADAQRSDAPIATGQPAPAVTSPLPNLYALVVGVSAYSRPELRLHYPAKDAKDLVALLRTQQGKLYRSVTVKLLTDRGATRQEVMGGLQWLQRQMTDKDVAMVFLAGHGVEDAGTGQYYYLPYDADLAQLLTSAVPAVIIRESLLALAGKAVLFLDTCHAGEVFSNRGLRGAPDWSRFVAELAAADNGVVVFSAARGQQSAQEDRRWGNGAFTKALLEGLSGQADREGSGRVTLNMLDLYISERVKKLTSGMQTPVTAKPSSITDFPLTVRIPGRR